MSKNRTSKKKTDKPKMDHKNPRAMASIHPPPGRSPLWKHLDEIRSMRRARATWEEVAKRIGELEGRTIHHTVIYNFFKRYANRLKKTGMGQPLGFEPLPGEAPSSPTYDVQAARAAAQKPAIKPPTPPGADDDLLEPAVEETVSERAAREARERRQRNQQNQSK